MKKRIFIALVAVMTALSITACEKEAESSSPASEGTTTAAETTETSSVSESFAADKEDYLGYWEYPAGEVLIIHEDAWELFSTQGEIISTGPMGYDEEAVYLTNADGSSVGGKVAFNEKGELIDSEMVLKKLDVFPYGNSDGDHESDQEESLTGWWKRPDRENQTELATYFHLDSENGKAATYDADGKQYNEYDFRYADGEYVICSGDESDEDVHLIYDGTNLLRRYETEDVLWLERTTTNPERMSKYGFLCGTWHFGGNPDTAYITIDTQGFYIAYYANGSVESEGSVEQVEEYEDLYRYDFIDPSGNVFIGIYMDSDTQFHIGNADDRVYILAD